jgi:hypothetical protein
MRATVARGEVVKVKTKSAERWIQAGLWSLPAAWLLTAWGSLDPQPDQEQDPEAWARFVSTDYYQLSHLLGGTAGTILALFGTVALGCFLAGGRSGRLGLAAMVAAAVGTALLLVPAVISTFATPAIGRAYLAGHQDVMQLAFPESMSAAFLLGLLLAFVGTVLLGVAVWRSGILPRWSGLLWAAGALLFYALGVVLGQATTGSSLPTQVLGALLMAAAAAWFAVTSMRGAAAPTG